MQLIQKLLHEKIGLNPSSVGDSSIERAVKHRLEHMGGMGVDDYYKHIINDSQELYELIEEVVVPETWFFRNKSPFEALQEYVKKEIMPKLAVGEKLKLLSVPCSTGEEPFSIAISLAEAGIDLGKVQIDAIDISKRAITKARRAIYGKNSFRGSEDEQIKNKYFVKGGAGYRLCEEIRDSVNFIQGNFLIGPLSQLPEFYHGIFCRNLLIYFDRPTQKAALEKLHRSLVKNGMLFVGHAETSQVTRQLFQPLYTPRSFGYIKSSEKQDAVNRQNPSAAGQKIVPDQWKEVFDKISKIPVDRPNRKLPVLPKRKSSVSSDDSINQSNTSKLISLTSVERLANQGKYESARDACKQYLLFNPDSAQAYYLMGLIKNSIDETGSEAEVLLRKAIYLDPNHEQALLLSSLIAEKRGEYEKARAFKRRAKRVSERNIEQAG